MPLGPRKGGPESPSEPEGIRPELAASMFLPETLDTFSGDLWKDILGVDRVGIFDNFFSWEPLASDYEDAGTSTTGIPITVQDIFDHQTIAGLRQMVTLRMEAATGRPCERKPPKAEVFTPLTIDIPISGDKEMPGAILLTGITGYLGAHLFYELYHKTAHGSIALFAGRIAKRFQHASTLFSGFI